MREGGHNEGLPLPIPIEVMVVTTDHPFYLQHDVQSWEHAKTAISLLADFITSLAGE
jgi:hypothetical protein